MAQQDIFGQEISLSDPRAVEAWDETQRGFLAHAAVTPDHLSAVLATDPDFVLGQAAKGLFCLMLGRSEMSVTASEAAAAARKALAQGAGTPREALYADALDALLAGSPSGAVQKLEEVLDDHPRDPLAMKLSHAIRFVLGDATGMRRSVERVLPAWGPDHPALGYLRGCHSFALEETGEYRKAEAAGRAALELAPDDAWALHSVAHVHEMTCNPRAGLDWLSGREGAWGHCNNFRYHVWWHKALMHLDLGESEAVLDLYDTEIRRDKTDDYRDISNGASLLSRLELDGIDVGNRWEEMADICEHRTEDGSLIFADLHYLLALVGGERGEAAERLISRIHADGRSGRDEISERMRNPGMAAADGLEAFGAGDYGRAFRCLTLARPSMLTAGGSHAQRDVFERLTIDCGIRSGCLDEAEMILNERIALRSGRTDGYAGARLAMIAGFRNPGMAAAQAV